MSHVSSTMKDIKLAQFKKMIKDSEKMMKDNPMMKEYTVLKEENDGATKEIYMKMKMPMMSERESLVR